MRDHLGNVVARRQLKTSDGRTVVVQIGLPKRVGSDWRCPYAITGLPERILEFSWGVDSMQATQLAFAWIRARLTPFRDSLVWMDTALSIGFPLQVPEDLGTELEDRVQRLIAAERKRSRQSKGRSTRRPKRS